MKKILPDTSFLISCVEFKIDWEIEFRKIIDSMFQIIILDKVKKEIETVIEKGGKQGRNAKLCKKIIEIKNYKTKKSSLGHTDDILLELSDSFLICTQDTELRKRIKKRNKYSIVIRQKKYFKIE